MSTGHIPTSFHFSMFFFTIPSLILSSLTLSPSSSLLSLFLPKFPHSSSFSSFVLSILFKAINFSFLSLVTFFPILFISFVSFFSSVSKSLPSSLLYSSLPQTLYPSPSSSTCHLGRYNSYFSYFFYQTCSSSALPFILSLLPFLLNLLPISSVCSSFPLLTKPISKGARQLLLCSTFRLPAFMTVKVHVM